MAAGFALQLAVNGYVVNVCKTLQTCSSSDDLEKVIRSLIRFVKLAAADCYNLSGELDPDHSSPLAQCEARVIEQCRQLDHLLDTLQILLFRHLETIACSLFPGRCPTQLSLLCYNTFACCITTVCCSEVAIAAQRHKAVLHQTSQLFSAAPAAAALQALAT